MFDNKTSSVECLVHHPVYMYINTLKAGIPSIFWPQVANHSKHYIYEYACQESLTADYAADDKYISFGVYCSLHLCDDKASVGSNTAYVIKLSSKGSSAHSAHMQRNCDVIASLKSSKALYCINRKAVCEVTARDGNCQIFGLKCQITLL